MMAMVKIAILLFVVGAASALENSSEVDSIQELHPASSPALSPSSDHDGPDKASIECAVDCIAECEDKKSFAKIICIGSCLVKCIISPTDDVSEMACAFDCLQSSANDFHYKSKMDDQISACAKQCKKD